MSSWVPDNEPVSRLLRGLEGGDTDAAERLWNCYFGALMRHAENRIGRLAGGRLEAEDVAVSVFESLYNGARLGRFKSVQNRDELWHLLLKMTHRKVVSAIRSETAARRGGGSRPHSLDKGSGSDFAALVSNEPTPQELVVMEEEYQRALDLLPNPMLKQIAVLMLEGNTIEEISQKVGVATATVTRKRRLIRDTWKQDLQE